MNDFREYKGYCDRYLMHHGIKGQHWGDRNGPPYPLDSQVSMKIKSRSRDELSRGLINPRYLKTKEFSDKEHDRALKEYNLFEEAESRSFADGSSSYFSPAKCFAKRSPSEFRSGKGDQGMAKSWLLHDDESLSDSTKNVNPDYGEVGTTNNCTRCGVAIELRQRGLNVVAARASSGCSPWEVETWFKGAKTKGYSSSEEMRRDLLKQGDGASGTISGYYGDGLGSGNGGHTIHYKIDGRRVTIQDGQINKSFDTFDKAWSYYNFSKGACAATRLDNCDPNFEEMGKDSVFGVNTGGRVLGTGDGFYHPHRGGFNMEAVKRLRDAKGGY